MLNSYISESIIYESIIFSKTNHENAQQDILVGPPCIKNDRFTILWTEMGNTKNLKSVFFEKECFSLISIEQIKVSVSLVSQNSVFTQQTVFEESDCDSRQQLISIAIEFSVVELVQGPFFITKECFFQVYYI